VSGEVDLNTAPELARALWRASRAGKEVQIDLEDVDFMDASGLHVLTKFALSDAPGAPPVTITSGSRQVRRLFEVSGFAPLLPIGDVEAVQERRTA
jgi:anti-sigma B factor antagonist